MVIYVSSAWGRDPNLVTNTVTFHVGDVLERLDDIPDGSIDLVVTSPPFFTLRDYLPVDHEHKHREIGAEASPAEFLSTLLTLAGRLRAKLAPHGSLCFELGDTYAGSGGAGGDYADGGMRAGQPAFKGSASRAKQTSAKYRPGYVRNDRPNRKPQATPKAYDGGKIRDRQADEDAGIVPRRLRTHRQLPGYPLEKSLCLIPTLFAASLAYGWNMLDPSERFEPWRVRNLIVWHRTNPTPGDLGDKVRPSTSYVTVACIAKDRWFDLEDERTAHKAVDRRQARYEAELAAGNRSSFHDHGNDGQGRNQTLKIGGGVGNPAGAPPLDCWFIDDDPAHDVWTIATVPYKGSHYATFPPELPRRLISLSCPRQVCTSCGEPRRRILERARPDGERPAPGRQDRAPEVGWQINRTTVGWTHCGCGDGCVPTEWVTLRLPVLDDEGQPVLKEDGTQKMRRRRVASVVGECVDASHWRPGVVLDPFLGSGTTALAAARLGRDCVGVDLDERNVELTRRRLAEDVLLVVESDGMSRHDWSVDARLPGTRGQVPGQQSLFG